MKTYDIVIFGETGEVVTSSCTSCSGCGDKNAHRCTEETPSVTSDELYKKLFDEVERCGLSHILKVSYRDVHKDDIDDYTDVKTLINMSFAFPILTVDKKIKYMGPFNEEHMVNELKSICSI